MKRFLTFCLILLLCAPAIGIPTGARDNRVTIGAFTGPRTGAAQDDNIKASLDILHDKIEATMAQGGSVFYVDSGVASTAGTSWSTAVGTIELATAKCTDAAGDLILVAPYHAETMTDTKIDLDKDSITLWGLGTGVAMPTLTYDTANDLFTIGADGDNVTVHGIRFVSSVTVVASAIVVEAACTDWIIEDCVFVSDETTVAEFVDTIYVTTGSADRGIIRRNRFLGDVGANADPDSSINFIDCDFLQIYDNEFSGDIADAHIFNETTASNYVSIHDNRIMCGYIGDAATYLDTTPGISLVATTTGWIQDNFIVTNVVSPQDAIVAADCYCSNNYYAETQGASGSVLIGRSNSEGALAALGVSMTDGSTRGRIVYCDSGETSTVEDGLSWATATDTLDEAIDLCTADDGSTIFIAPGHTETMGAAADEVDIDQHGLTIIGLGNGDLIPRFDYTDDTTKAFTVAADDVTIRNLNFHGNVTDVADGLHIASGSTGVTIEDCIFDLEDPGTDDFIECIDSVDGTADGLVVRNCHFYMGAGACNAAINTKDADHMILEDNIIHGDYAVACIKNNTTASNHVNIRRNDMYNGTIGAGLNEQPCIELLGTTSGIVSDNVCVCDVDTPDLAIVTAHCYFSGDTYNEFEAAAYAAVDIGLVPGRTYAAQITGVAIDDADLFLVAGGPIMIMSFVGEITTVIPATACTTKIMLDTTEEALDYDFSTAVDMQGWVDGGRIVFSSASPSVLSTLALTTAGSTLAMDPWYCAAGMIEAVDSDDNTPTGAITWSMTYIPLAEGVTVTVQ